jgi:hypothetical protein
MNDEKKRKLAELERLGREGDEDARRIEAEHAKVLLDILTDQELAQIDKTAVAAQFDQLVDHLIAARAVDPGEFDEEPQLEHRWIDKAAGTFVVLLWIEGIGYFEAGGVLGAERKQEDRVERAIVSDDDGSLGEWKVVKDPPGRGTRDN